MLKKNVSILHQGLLLNNHGIVTLLAVCLLIGNLENMSQLR